MRRLPRTGRLEPQRVIGVDLDSTLIDNELDIVHWGVIERIKAMVRETRLPVVLVTARPMWIAGQNQFIASVLEHIRSVSGWAPDHVIAEYGLASGPIDTYKVRMFDRHGFRPVAMIDDMPDVLTAVAHQFRAVPILAQDGRLKRLVA